MSENWDVGKLGCLKNGTSDECRKYGMSDKWYFGKLELKTILSVSSPTLVWELSEKWAVWKVECLESELTPFVYTLFFYKNIFYKNIEAQKSAKFKNILRICWGSAGFSQKKIKSNFRKDRAQLWSIVIFGSISILILISMFSDCK